MQDFPLYPLFLNLAQQLVLIVGGGVVGLRKARGLADSGARITVVSPVFHADFARMAGVERIKAHYAARHMKRKAWRLVFAATDSAEVNARVREDARKHDLLCCRADEPEEGDFLGGATVRDPKISTLVVAVSTGGASPVLAARICRQAAAGVDPVLPLLAKLLAGWRGRLKKEIGAMEVRKELLKRLAGEEMETILREKGVAGARRVFGDWLRAARRAASKPAQREGRGLRNASSRRAVEHAH
jgi:siroheme synthase-like protein